MPYQVFGLPTHILLIHLAVIGIPTACLAVIAVAARPKWRTAHGLKAAGLAVVMVPVTYATQLAGDQLFNHRGFAGDALAVHHKNLGGDMVYFMLAVAVLAVLMVLADRGGFADHRAPMVALASLNIAASAVCIYWVILVGDAGARAVWSLG